MKASRPLSAIVVGCGKIGSTFASQTRRGGVHSHVQGYIKNPRTKLVGVSDTNPAALAAARTAWGVEGDTDAIALCSRLGPDIVSICAPNEMHFPIARELLERCPPRLLFVEKPVAVSSTEASDLIDRARQANCSLLVNYSRRFDPRFQQIKRELDEGMHGKPLLALVLYGKGLAHSGSHAIDLLRFWLGEPREAGRRASEPVLWGPAGDATHSAWIRFPGECRAVFEAFDERVATVWEVDLFTEKSRVRAFNGGEAWELSRAQESPVYAGYREYIPTGREKTDPLFLAPADALGHAIQNIVEHLESGAPLLCTGEDGRKALQWVETILIN